MKTPILFLGLVFAGAGGQAFSQQIDMSLETSLTSASESPATAGALTQDPKTGAYKFAGSRLWRPEEEGIGWDEDEEEVKTNDVWKTGHLYVCRTPYSCSRYGVRNTVAFDTYRSSADDLSASDLARGVDVLRPGDFLVSRRSPAYTPESVSLTSDHYRLYFDYDGILKLVHHDRAGNESVTYQWENKADFYLIWDGGKSNTFAGYTGDLNQKSSWVKVWSTPKVSTAGGLYLTVEITSDGDIQTIAHPHPKVRGGYKWVPTWSLKKGLWKYTFWGHGYWEKP